MNRTKALLLGLVGLIFIWIWLLIVKWDFIEKDVADRTEQVLSESGHDWAEVYTDGNGRDVTLSGIGRTQEQIDSAIEIAKNVNGVRAVNHGAIELKPFDAANLSASFNSGAIILSGNVASQSDVDGLLSAANAISTVVTNNLNISSDTAQPDWLSSVVSKLPELAALESGELSVSDDKLSLTGIVRKQAHLDQISASLSGLLGITAADVSGLQFVALPDAAFSMAQVNGIMQLEGKVANQAAFDALASTAKKAFGEVDVSGLIVDGGVASASWLDTVSGLMSGLAALENPGLNIVDGAVKVSGQVFGTSNNTDAASAWNDLVQSLSGDGVTIDSGITELILSDPKFDLSFNGSKVNLSGSLSDFAEQSALEWAAGALSEEVDASNITTAKNIAVASWTDNVTKIISVLSGFNEATLSANSSGISLSGITETEADRDAIIFKLQEVLGGSISDLLNLNIDVLKTNAQLAAEAKAAKTLAEAEALAAAQDNACENKRDTLLRSNTILFTTGSAEIDASNFGLLDNLSIFINECSEMSIEVSGHTDNTGDAAFNQYLSKARAGSVVRYLTNSGVDENRLSAKGYGSDQPIADNAIKTGRAQNRRIEINIIKIK